MGSRNQEPIKGGAKGLSLMVKGDPKTIALVEAWTGPFQTRADQNADRTPNFSVD